MDVICLLSKVLVDGELPDGRLQRDPLGAGVVDTSRYGDTTPLVVNGPRIHEFMQEMHREVFAGRPAGLLNVGETPATSIEQAVLYTDPARGEVDMVFQFEHVTLDQNPRDKFDTVDLDLVALKRSLHRWQAGLADVGWNSLYWKNPDQPRAVSRFGDDHPDHWLASAKALGTILHGLRGTPYVYQGEELGMTNYPFRSGADHRDVEAVNYYADVVTRGLHEDKALAGLARMSRDNARTPMQWDGSAGAGFTSGTPWLPVNPNHTWLNAAAQVSDPSSVFAHYRALIRLRHELPVLADGSVELLLPDDPAIWAYTRSTAGERLLVVANCGREPRAVPLEEWYGAELVLGNLPGTPATYDAAATTLAPWDARIYLLRR
jgi:oligo-1,6-glucosidase